jgi:hypothetical protein
MGTMARTAVVAGTATAVAGGVRNHQEQKAAAQQQAAAPAPAAAPSAEGGQDEMIDQLKQLADMKASGILSDEEFEAAKAKVLAG